MGGTLLLGALLCGCATQADLQQLRKEQDALRLLVADQKAAMESTRREVESLRGEFDALQHRLPRGREGEERARWKALEERLAALEKHTTTAPSQETEKMVKEEVPLEKELARKEEALLSGRGQGEEAYRQALISVQQRDYQKAIQQFRDFLRKHPQSEYADNSQYWIGECYYAMRDYNRAILEFNEVLLKYPRGDKIPAALLKQAYAFAELGDKIDARLILQKIISEHPRSEEAEKARQKLTALGG